MGSWKTPKLLVKTENRMSEAGRRPRREKRRQAINDDENVLDDENSQ